MKERERQVIAWIVASILGVMLWALEHLGMMRISISSPAVWASVVLAGLLGAWASFPSALNVWSIDLFVVVAGSVVVVFAYTQSVNGYHSAVSMQSDAPVECAMFVASRLPNVVPSAAKASLGAVIALFWVCAFRIKRELGIMTLPVASSVLLALFFPVFRG